MLLIRPYGTSFQSHERHANFFRFWIWIWIYNKLAKKLIIQHTKFENHHFILFRNQSIYQPKWITKRNKKKTNRASRSLARASKRTAQQPAIITSYQTTDKKSCKLERQKREQQRNLVEYNKYDCFRFVHFHPHTRKNKPSSSKTCESPCRLKQWISLFNELLTT